MPNFSGSVKRSIQKSLNRSNIPNIGSTAGNVAEHKFVNKLAAAPANRAPNSANRIQDPSIAYISADSDGCGRNVSVAADIAAIECYSNWFSVVMDS